MDALLDVPRGRLNRILHLAQLVQLHGSVDFSLDIAHVALCLAKQGSYRTGHLGQLLGTNDDQRHGADHRHLGNVEVKHA